MNTIEEYLKYTDDTEAHKVAHRWCIMSAIATLLGRRVWLQHGHFKVNPNMYVMLLGNAGSRKSTAIKMMKKHLIAIGYDKLAADKTRKEKFLMDLAGMDDSEDEKVKTKEQKQKQYDEMMSQNLWGDSVDGQEPKESYIMADEWIEFSGTGDTEFYTTLGNLWDWDEETRPFKQRFKNSKSVSIFQPTINILGGSNQENFVRAFPPEIMGTGFLSRMILVYVQRGHKKFAFPPIPAKEDTDAIREKLRRIAELSGHVAFKNSGVENLLTEIYSETGCSLSDIRFSSYLQRRFTHLLKLCIIQAASRFSTIITEEDVINANTTLAASELLMPKALGEFGKAKNSDILNKILREIEEAPKGLTVIEIFKLVSRDVDNMRQVGDMLGNLQQAKQIHFVTSLGRWLPYKEERIVQKHVDFKLITQEERNLL